MSAKKWIAALCVSCLLSFGVGVHVGQQNAGEGSTPVEAVARPQPVRVLEVDEKISDKQAAKIYELLEGRKVLPKNRYTAVDNSRFAKRGKHTMATYTVSGAGTAAVNGAYVEDGVSNGKPIYHKGVSHSLKYVSGAYNRWEITDYGTLDAYYRHTATATFPQDGTWQQASGAAPVPSVTLADTAKPTATAAAVSANGMNVAVTHSETVTGTTGYVVKVNGVTRSQASASTLAGVTTIVMNQAIENANTVTLDYTPGNVADGAANTMDAFTAQAVTNSSRFRQWGAGRYVGLSTTTKPAAANGSEFFEEDGLKAVYKRISGAWVLQSIPISGTPTAGQVPTASSGTAAAWATPAAGGGSSDERDAWLFG